MKNRLPVSRVAAALVATICAAGMLAGMAPASAVVSVSTGRAPVLARDQQATAARSLAVQVLLARLHGGRRSGVAGSGLFVGGAASGIRQRAVDIAPTVAVGAGAVDVAVDASTHTLYTANANDDSISVVDTARCRAGNSRGCGQTAHTLSLPSGGFPQAIALDTATGTGYVTEIGLNTVAVINIRTCNAEDFAGCGQSPVMIPTGENYPINLAVNRATDTIYVANIGTTTVSVINGATCNGSDHAGCAQIPPTVTVGQAPIAVAVDETTDTVYVPEDFNGDGTTVSVINGTTCNGTHHGGCGQNAPTITIGSGPTWIALDPATHTAYTTNNNDNTVSVIDTATCNGTDHAGCGQTTTAVPVGSSPGSLTIAAHAHTVYVANNQDDTLSVIDAATCDATDRSSCSLSQPTVQGGSEPQSVATESATGTVYESNADNTVSVLAVVSCDASHSRGCRHPAPTTAVGNQPSGIAVDRATHTVYVANQNDSTVSVIDAATCNARDHAGCVQPAVTVAAGGGDGGLAIDQATDTIYTANSGDNTVSVINGATCNATDHAGCGQTPASVAVGINPFGLTVDQHTDTVYVGDLAADQSGTTVSVINGAICNGTQHSGCGQIPPTLTVGTGPYDLTVNEATHTLYVAGTGTFQDGVFGTTVSVVDAATCNGTNHSGCGQHAPTVTVGPDPVGLAVNQAANIIYVANNGGFGQLPASLSEINGATCDATNHTGCNQSPPQVNGLGRGAFGIALDQATHTVYTANHGDNTVSVINVARPAAGGSPAPPRVAVGGSPNNIAIDHAEHTIYITDGADGTVTILPEKPVR